MFRGDPLSQGFANRWHVEGKVFPAHSETEARTGSLAGRHENITDRFADARAQRFDPPSQLQALEVEGIDVAVLFRTFGAHVIALDGMDGDLATAICRAFNNWLYDFCAIDRQRLRLTAQMPLQDVELAAAEARRVRRGPGCSGAGAAIQSRESPSLVSSLLRTACGLRPRS